PSAMYPRAFDQRVKDSGTVLIDGVKGAQWPGKIFGVEPSPNGQLIAVNVLHVRREIARLPVIVVGVVLRLVVPQKGLSVEVLSVDIRDRPYGAEKVVTTGGAVVEGLALLGRQRRIVLRLERAVEAEIRRQHEGSAVIAIVAHEQVGHGGLRRGRLQGGMRVDDAGRGEEAGVGDSPDADTAIVVGDI